MKTLIDKINEFETGVETVQNFNSIFLQAQLKDFTVEDIVTIGEPCSPETVRLLTVNGYTFRHDFTPTISSLEVEIVLEENEYD